MFTVSNASGPMWLRCVILTLTGHEELLLCFIAAWTCVVVSVMLVVCSLYANHYLQHQ